MGWDSAILRETLLKNGRDKVTLARLAGVAPETISRWERGIQRPSSLALARLAKPLGIPAAMLGTTPDAVREAVLRRQDPPATKQLLLDRALQGDKTALRVVAAGEGMALPESAPTVRSPMGLPTSKQTRRKQRQCPRCLKGFERKFNKHIAKCREPISAERLR